MSPGFVRKERAFEESSVFISSQSVDSPHEIAGAESGSTDTTTTPLNSQKSESHRTISAVDVDLGAFFFDDRDSSQFASD
jgi:hypothetical protein